MTLASSSKLQRTLLLSPFFHPEPISTGRYNTVLAEGLREAGAEVTVVCSHPLYPSWIPTISNEELTQIKTLRGGIRIRYSTRPWLRRAVLELWFAMHALHHVARRRHSIDAVVSVFPPSLFQLFVNVVLPTSVQRVGIVHDLQGVHAQAKGGRLSQLVGHVITIVEKRAFRQLDKVIALSSAMADELHGNYGIPTDKLIVRYPFASVVPQSANTDELGHLFADKKTHVVYSGALGEKQNPPGLMAIFALANRALPDVQFHVFSEGPLFETMRQEARESRLSNVDFQPLVPQRCLGELYERSDFQIIPQSSGTENGSMPSKLPNILAHNCKVFAICDIESELATVVNRFKAGEISPSWEPEQVLEVLKNAIQSRPTTTESAAKHQEAIHKAFSLESLVDAILSEPSKRAPEIDA